MDFSLHEQRRLAQIEEELSTDRRLVALMELLGSQRTRAWRQMQYASCRLRRPRRSERSLGARLALGGALLLTAAVPVVLIVALVLGLGALAVLTVCVLPMPVLLVVVTYRWAGRSRGGKRATRES
jgi:VIT1/CCC1 family predicted Fe2+/Mn2+ transporter